MEEVVNVDRGFPRGDEMMDSPFKLEEAATKPANKSQKGLMLEDIEDGEEGELDYEEEDGEVQDEGEDLPDLPEYDPSSHSKQSESNLDKKEVDEASEEGEIVSDDDNEEREEGEIKDDDETGQVFICVDPVNDKWKKVSRTEQKRLQELEDGQIEEVPEDGQVEDTPSETVAMYIPRTLCKYFEKGLCRWGSTCRFLHPGVNELGVPKELQPTWNATAGNYVMHRPPGMYPNALGKATAPVQIMPVAALAAPVLPQVPIPPKRETAWERGLRRAKEVKEAGIRRRQNDEDFETKKMSMRIPEHVIDKESSYQPGDTRVVEKTMSMWDIQDKDSNRRFDHIDRRFGRENRFADRFADRYRGSRDNSDHGRYRMHDNRYRDSRPHYRVERSNERERERERERDRLGPADLKPIDPRIKDATHETKENTPPMGVQSTAAVTSSVAKPPLGTVLEWTDPWMRSQPKAASAIEKPLDKDDTKQAAAEQAASDSDESSSDSDSDTDSSSSKSSDSDTDSDSDSEDDPAKKAAKTGKALLRPEQSIGLSSKSEVLEDPRQNREHQRARHEEHRLPNRSTSDIVTEATQRNEPLSYEEWKRLQTLQKAEYHQHLANEYKTALEIRNDAANRDLGKAKSKRESRLEKHERQHGMSRSRNRSSIDSIPGDPRRNVSALRSDSKDRSLPLLDPLRRSSVDSTSAINDDRQSVHSQVEVTRSSSSILPTKLQDPRLELLTKGSDVKERSSSHRSDSDSESDSDSDSDSGSDSDSSDSSDSDSGSDSDGAKKLASLPTASLGNDSKLPVINKAGLTKSDIGSKPKIGPKRPARKDDLLKELKAVEDAIARKRAKID